MGASVDANAYLRDRGVEMLTARRFLAALGWTSPD
jgi:hypothetical protein